MEQKKVYRIISKHLSLTNQFSVIMYMFFVDTAACFVLKHKHLKNLIEWPEDTRITDNEFMNEMQWMIL
jgi:hypothetical protein